MIRIISVELEISSHVVITLLNDSVNLLNDLTHVLIRLKEHIVGFDVSMDIAKFVEFLNLFNHLYSEL